MTKSIPCARCHRANSAAEMTTNSVGAWLCRGCQAEVALEDASQLLKMKPSPMRFLGLVVFVGLIFLLLMVSWFSEGMRRAL